MLLYLLALTPPAAAGARPAAQSSLRSLLRGLLSDRKKNMMTKNFFDFAKFFSIEVVYMMSRLRMQNFMIIGQGVPAVEVVTDKQTNLRIYYIDFQNLFNPESRGILVWILSGPEPSNKTAF